MNLDSGTGAIAAALAATAALVLSAAEAEEAVPTSYDAAPQRATADDMRIMAPYIGEFRSATYTGARTVCAKSKGADGVVTYVRDAFEVVDDNTWKNKTRVREGEDGKWMLVYEGTYTRVLK